MDLRYQLGVLRAWWKTIVVGTLLAGLAAFALSSVLPRTWEGEARLLVGQGLQTTGTDTNQFDAARNLAETYAEMAKTRPVLERVMATVGVEEAVVEFAKRMSVVADRSQPIVNIVVADGDRDRAVAAANAMAAELIGLSPTLQDATADVVREDLDNVEAQLAQVREEMGVLTAVASRTPAQQTRLETLEDRLVRLQTIHASLLQLLNASGASRVTLIEPAVAPDGPASPRPLFNTAIGLALGLLVALAVAFLWEKLDDRVRSPEAVERITGLATLASILEMPTDRNRPELYRLATVLYPRSPAAEAFRALRTNIEFASVDAAFRTVVVTSSEPREGKTVVAANLAVVLAQAGRRTLLVDADLRRPSIHTLFSLSAGQGLTDLIRSDDVRVSDVALGTEVPNLRVVPSGPLPANPAELAASHRMELTMDRLLEEADVVVIDTPPVGAVTDAAVLAARSDVTLFVIHASRVSEAAVRRARGALAKVNARVIGAVLNGLPSRLEDPRNAYYAAFPAVPGAGAAEVGPTPAPAPGATPGPAPVGRAQGVRSRRGPTS